MMSEDKLARFRGLPVTGATKAAQEETDEYSAFGAKDKPSRLRIRCAAQPTISIRNDLLLTVTYDELEGTNFVLLYQVLLVMVRGRNLKELIQALENDNAHFIQEFNPHRWAKPADGKAAFIES